MIARGRALVEQGIGALSKRKYVMGVVVAWALVMGLTSSASNHPAVRHPRTQASAPLTSPGAGTAPFSLAAPVPAAPSAAPMSFSPPSFGGFTLPSFGAQPPPPATATLTCPYPTPQSQTTPFNPGEFLAFESPFLDLSGPFAAYDIPTLGAIAPLVPFAAPIVSIAEPVMNEVTPNMAQAIYDIVALEHDAKLDNPQFDKYVAAGEPYWLQLVSSLTPYEQKLASSTAGQCTVLFENDLSTVAAEHAITLPEPPLIVPNIAGSSQSANVAAAETSSSHPSPVQQIELSWAGGMPGDLPVVVHDLAAAKVPVEITLADIAPAGALPGGTGFADFVALTVHALPGASVFEIDGPSASPAAPSSIADLAYGLAAADFTRLPGQLVGMGVPDSALANQAHAFWSAFDGAAEGYQASLVDFVAADLTPVVPRSVAQATAEATAEARLLEQMWSSTGGVPSDVPLFATLDTVGQSPSEAAAEAQLAAYGAALAPLHVAVFGLRSAS
ncbi:MAG: hypothetical protein ACYDD4_07675 [Acidimicrobiales bacterium]